MDGMYNSLTQGWSVLGLRRVVGGREGGVPAPQTGAEMNSSGVYICKSVVNDLRHESYICKSEEIYLTYEHRIEIPVEFTYVNK